MNKKVDIRELKNRHQLIAVMIESGERFDADSDDVIWPSMATPGLTVNVLRQTWELKLPGQDPITGDVFDWVKRRYSWNFAMVLRYLQARPSDPPLKLSIGGESEKKKERSFDHEPNRDYTKPIDAYQRKALALDPDGNIAKYFMPYYSWLEIIACANKLPTRFLPIIAVDFEECFECFEPFDWENTTTRAYIPQFGGYEISEENKRIFFLDDDNALNYLICEKCVNVHTRRFLSMMNAAWSALARKRGNDE